MALTGLQLLPYMAALGLSALIAFGWRRTGWSFVMLGVSLAAGLTGWIVVLVQKHAFKGFVDSVTGASVAGAGIRDRLVAMRDGLVGDHSTIVLIFVLLALVIAEWKRGRLRRASPAVCGLVSVLLIPIVVSFSGKFPDYYAWMKFLPGSLFAVAAVSEIWDLGKGWWWVSRILVMILLFAALPFPARLVVTAMQWQERDYRPVAALVTRQIRPTDSVYCDVAAYYPVKSGAAQIFTTQYVPMFRSDEIAGITALVIDPATFPDAERLLGGKWQAVDQYSSGSSSVEGTLGMRTAKFYRLTVYRRQ
jgi:hypothetical protein